MFRESVGNKTFQEIIAAKKDEKWEDITGIGTIMKKIIYHGVPNMRPQKHMLCKISYSATRQDGCLAEPRRTSYIHLGDCDVS